ncbi:hypothetical protein MMC30_002664 [Trapelia coarctata]|nr:hypothetical protein [Trapelia coarctata]
MQPHVLSPVALSKQALSYLPKQSQYKIQNWQTTYPEQPTNASVTEFLENRHEQVMNFDEQLQIVVEGLAQVYATGSLSTPLAGLFQRAYQQTLERRIKLAAEDLAIRCQRDRALHSMARAQAANTPIRPGYCAFLEQAFIRKQKRWAELKSGDLKNMGWEYFDWDEQSKLWYNSLSPLSKQVWCPITKGFAPACARRTVHIASPNLGYDNLAYLFNEDKHTGHKTVAWQNNNALVMHERLATLFNEGALVLVPLPVEHGKPLDWKVVLLDTANRDEELSFSGQKLSDLHNTPLAFLNGNRPHPRYLFYRFIISVIRGARCLSTGSPIADEKWAVLHQWTLRGFFVRNSVVASLAKFFGLWMPEKFWWETTFGCEIGRMDEYVVVRELVVETMGGRLVEEGEMGREEGGG